MSTKIKKKSGYYWIKLNPTSEWTIALYNATLNAFRIIGSEKLENNPTLVKWTEIKNYIGLRKGDVVFEKLSGLNVGDSFNKLEFVNDVWGDNDEFTVRSYDAILTNTKKRLPGHEFKTLKGLVTRTK